MFTGIVQGLVEVADITHHDDISRLTLNLGALAEGVALGASVAVNGTCLTVTSFQDGRVDFDVIAETLRTTNLGKLKKQDRVNVERSFRVGDEIGGHIVSGHVTGVSKLLSRAVEGHDHVLRFALEPHWQAYVFHKGFVALDGASITVSAIDRSEGWFEVSLIPETLARTTLGFVGESDPVNIEVDAQTVTTVDTVKELMQDKEWLTQLQA